MKYIIDSIFSIMFIVGVTHNYLYTGEITTGEFYICLILGYVGARYVLFNDLQRDLLEMTYKEEEDFDE